MTGWSVTTVCVWVFFVPDSQQIWLWTSGKIKTLPCKKRKKKTHLQYTGKRLYFILTAFLPCKLYDLSKGWLYNTAGIRRHAAFVVSCQLQERAQFSFISKWRLVSYHAKFTVSDDMKTNAPAIIIHSVSLLRRKRDYSRTSTILWLYRKDGSTFEFPEKYHLFLHFLKSSLRRP